MPKIFYPKPWQIPGLLDGTVTLLVNAINPQPPEGWFQLPECECYGEYFWTEHDLDDDMMGWFPSYDNGVKAFAHPGDVLLGREAWCETGVTVQPYAYKADEQNITLIGESGSLLKIAYRYEIAKHMPFDAVRINLRVKTVRVMRVQELTLDEIIKAGCKYFTHSDSYVMSDTDYDKIGLCHSSAQIAFSIRWDADHKKDLALYGWDANLWVECVEVERVLTTS